MPCVRSLDSAEVRAAAAKARLRDFGEGDVTSKAQPASLLPSALDVLGDVSTRGRPSTPCPCLAGRPHSTPLTA
jgi:hypothetical protein